MFRLEELVQQSVHLQQARTGDGNAVSAVAREEVPILQRRQRRRPTSRAGPPRICA